MSERTQWLCAVALLLLPFIGLAACDESIVAPELPEADPETVLFVSHFDDENGGEGVNNWSDFDNFNVLEGCVDLHGNGHFDVQPGNGIYIDMDGTCWDAGTIETKQTYQLVPDEQYLFEIWLAGNNRGYERDTLDITIGTVYTEQFIFESDKEFELFTRELSTSEPQDVKVTLSHYGGDNQGILVDLVRIRRVEKTAVEVAARTD